MGKQVDLHIYNAKILDVFNQKFEDTDLWIDHNSIYFRGQSQDLTAKNNFDAQGKYIVPGLIDAHLHIESSLLAPSELAKLELKHGITRIFADPHEIGSVSGVSGLFYMIEEARNTPLHIHYMLPSSVPATSFEHAGAVLHADALKAFYGFPEINGLAEVMDFPAVEKGDPDMLQKIKDAQNAGHHADGHGSGLSRQQLAVYRAVGIDTDHESTSGTEALERIQAGMKVFIREGTVERDEKAILPVVHKNNQSYFSFCTDDKSAIDIEKEGSIDNNVRLAIDAGIPAERAFTMASYNAAIAQHIDNVGALTDGFVADLVVTNDPTHFQAEKIMTNGQWVADLASQVLTFTSPAINTTLSLSDLKLPLRSDKAHVINIEPQHITTKHTVESVQRDADGNFSADENYAKIVVAERYHDLGHGLGIIHGFNLKEGAIASTIAHDSHNMIIAGVDDKAMIIAYDRLKRMGGGLILVDKNGFTRELPLEIAGLMSNRPYDEVIKKQKALRTAFASISENITFDPFLTLSFMALPVIPSLKITDQGLFDVDQFKFIDINPA
ncbi:adenine deaminase [Oenococcus sicerae]|uniref:Adenine deaminase n=1 Tax=Oenococcus sicerae TaxID=2203724 RepID=A0AAJ1VNS5_9LACO|nr:adenine deaminase [Oenococcus sicerae]MDN6900129.1 adenine deaminase [Oenococcus sicerae]